MYRLRVVVEEIRGFCDLPVTAGDYFEIDGSRLIVPPGKHVCIWALQSLMPLITVKQRNVVEANDWTPSTWRMICPDPNGMVIYRIDRVDSGVKEPEGTSGRDQHGLQAHEEPKESDEPGKLEEPGAHQNGPGIGANGGIPHRLLVTPAHCTGCRRCELACSFFHEGQYAPEMSRIRVTKDDAHGTDNPEVCRQCGTARCIQSCPSGALSKDAFTQCIVLDKSLCLQCGLCRKACPFGAIKTGQEGYPLICDLCGGEPRCVGVCPTGAVRFGRAGETPPAPRFSQPGKDDPARTPGDAGDPPGGSPGSGEASRSDGPVSPEGRRPVFSRLGEPTGKESDAP